MYWIMILNNKEYKVYTDLDLAKEDARKQCEQVVRDMGLEHYKIESADSDMYFKVWTTNHKGYLMHIVYSIKLIKAMN